MLEPTHGQERVSGPGQSLMVGLVATAALIIAFVLGFELGRGEDRTVIVTQTIRPGSSPSTQQLAATPTSKIQLPVVSEELQQAYYKSLGQAAWLVCEQDAALDCRPAPYVEIEGNAAFRPPSEQLARLQITTLQRGSRAYLVGALPGRAWIGKVAAGPAGAYQVLIGVTLNGTIDYYDLGDLAAGKYVVVSVSANTTTPTGQLTFAIGLAIE